jgi:hypothetical protein
MTSQFRGRLKAADPSHWDARRTLPEEQVPDGNTNRRDTLPRLRPTVIAMLLAGALSHGAVPATAQEAKDWQPMLRDSVEKIELRLGGARGAPLERTPEPLLRFDNKVGVVVDGVVFGWTDRGRPQAFAQVFLMTNGMVLHEFQSMSTSPMWLADAGKVQWQPGKPGIVWQAIADAPAPASSRAARLTQMRLLARRFLMKEDFRTTDDESRTQLFELRLLTNPIYRYPENIQPNFDGAVFAYVLGTDPEVLGMLEADLTATPATWRVSFAALTCYACRAFDGTKPVWEVEERLNKSRADGPYHAWRHHDEVLIGK